MKFVIILAIAQFSLSVSAASIYKQTLTVKTNKYATTGVFMGGKAGQSQMLQKVRRVSTPKNSTKVGMERVIFDLSQPDAKPLTEAGYYHVSIDKQNSRVVIELNQMMSALASEQSLRKLFASSNVVKSVDFTADPLDSTGTMVLNLKQPMKGEVFELAGNKKKTTRLVLDLKPM